MIGSRRAKGTSAYDKYCRLAACHIERIVIKSRKAFNDVQDDGEASWMVDETACASAAGSFADPMPQLARKRALARAIGKELWMPKYTAF